MEANPLRCRAGAAAYTHVDGAAAGPTAEQVAAAAEAGYRHVRVQVAVPGVATYGAASSGSAWDPLAYLHHVPPVLAEVRRRVGDGVELLHDAHERLSPARARQLVAAVADARLFFLEDALAPETPPGSRSCARPGPRRWRSGSSSTT